MTAAQFLGRCSKKEKCLVTPERMDVIERERESGSIYLGYKILVRIYLYIIFFYVPSEYTTTWPSIGRNANACTASPFFCRREACFSPSVYVLFDRHVTNVRGILPRVRDEIVSLAFQCRFLASSSSCARIFQYSIAQFLVISNHSIRNPTELDYGQNTKAANSLNLTPDDIVNLSRCLAIISPQIEDLEKAFAK